MMSLTFWFLWIKPDVICYFVIFERNRWILLPFGTKVSKLSDSLSSLFKKILSVNVSPDDVAAITPSSFNAEWCQSWHVLLSTWISQNVKLLHQECKIHFKSCFQLAFSLISFSPFPLCCMSSLPINVYLLFSDLIKTLSLSYNCTEIFVHDSYKRKSILRSRIRNRRRDKNSIFKNLLKVCDPEQR